MLLRSLSQLNYRNLNTPRLEFTGGINALIGPNASGKSNVLEAAYLACSGELPRGKIAETVRLGENEGFISAKIEGESGVSTVEVGLSPGKKVIRLDGQNVRTFDLTKVVAAVLITPEDSELVHGSPSTRRHYLDSLLSKLSLRYALVSREYTRVVEQRNAILRTNPTGLSLEVWTQKLLELGSEVTSLRKRAMARIAEIAETTYAEIAADGKHLAIELQGDEDLEAALEASRAEEQARGMTVVGPHRDDLVLTLGHSLQAYGSRGEARTAALALRVAEYQLLKDKLREAPILLLDDFSAELDENRRSYLLNLAAGTPQAVVSGTEAPPQFARGVDIREGRLCAH